VRPRPATIPLRAPERADVERPRPVAPPEREVRLRLVSPRDERPAPRWLRPPALRRPARLPPLRRPPPRVPPPDEAREPRLALRERPPPRLDPPRVEPPRWLRPRPPCLDDRLRPLDCLAI
jgi:hypothetical protein